MFIFFVVIFFFNCIFSRLLFCFTFIFCLLKKLKSKSRKKKQTKNVASNFSEEGTWLCLSIVSNYILVMSLDFTAQLCCILTVHTLPFIPKYYLSSHGKCTLSVQHRVDITKSRSHRDKSRDGSVYFSRAFASGLILHCQVKSRPPAFVLFIYEIYMLYSMHTGCVCRICDMLLVMNHAYVCLGMSQLNWLIRLNVFMSLRMKFVYR